MLASFQQLPVQWLPNHRSVLEVNNIWQIFLPWLCLLNLNELNLNYTLWQSIGIFLLCFTGKYTSIFLISLPFLFSSYDYRRGWMITLTLSIKLSVLLTFCIPSLHPTGHTLSGWRPVHLIILCTFDQKDFIRNEEYFQLFSANSKSSCLAQHSTLLRKAFHGRANSLLPCRIRIINSSLLNFPRLVIRLQLTDITVCGVLYHCYDHTGYGWGLRQYATWASWKNDRWSWRQWSKQ